MDHDILKLQPAWLDAQRPRMGRYVLGPLLGKGGMGEVTEAWDVVLCRTVALKILRNMEPTAVIRFMHEAQIHARVAHPHICRIYDVDASEGTVKIAMQLVRGPNLEQASPDLSLTEVVTVVAQVAEAVHAAHRLKLIHRDLKPSNILLERAEDGRWFPYICDFGLAMAMDEPALTYSHGVMGTPAYMAPEQFRGERDQVGPATDVYGLGGTLHFALLGRPPEGPTPRDPMPAQDRPASPHPKGQELPKDLKTIIRKCLEAEPELRYPTAAALAEDLWAFLNGEPIRGSVATPAGRLWRKAKPYVRTASFVAVGGFALLAAWLAEEAHQDRRHDRRAELARMFTREASDLENDMRLERMLPNHDLRPAFARARARMEGIRTRMAALGPEAEGPAWMALGRARYLIGDFQGAMEDGEKAWTRGFRGHDSATFLAEALAFNALFQPDHAPPPDLRRFEQLLTAGQRFDSGEDRFELALAAVIRKDYAKAAAEARANLKAQPWHGESAVLETVSTAVLAQQAFDQGDLAGAEAKYREAMDGAERFLAKGPSDERVQHAYLLAARGLAALQAARGTLALETLARLQAQCEAALRLDPGNADLHEDWLALQVQKAQRLEDLGQDSGPGLETALVFLGTRVKEPLPGPLRLQRTAVNLALAERNLKRNGQPGPALEEALKPPGPTPFLQRDRLGDALTFKARAEAAQGQDPRPSVTAALAHFKAQLQGRPSWTVCEAAAEAWLIQGEWEGAHGLDPSGSLQQARTLADQALQTNPASSSAYALEGLIHLMGIKQAPADRLRLLLLAQDRLRRSQDLCPAGRHQARLRALLKAS